MLVKKTRHLNIEPIHAEKVNSVSEKVAGDMAVNVSELFKSDYGVGITGYATIVPQCEEEGLFAFCAIACNKEVVVCKKITSLENNPLDAQLDYTAQVLKMLIEYLRANK